jgi:thioredoxin reductase (NADPH)
LINCDVLIVGGGPAGCSAAITARMRGLGTLVIFAGAGALEKAKRVDNYPGLPQAEGMALITAFREQAKALGAEFLPSLVQRILPSEGGFSILAGNDIFSSRGVILATGASRVPQLENEAEYVGSGVSYCATCDGMLYRGRRVSVVAADAHAVDEANFLAGLCAVTYYKEKHHDETGLLNTVNRSDDKPIGITRTSEGLFLVTDHGRIATDCVFILRPAVALSQLLPEAETKNGAITVDNDLSTTVPGVYAAGDLTGVPWQVAKAVGDGNRAALSVAGWLRKK